MQVSLAGGHPWYLALGLLLVGVGLVVWFYRRHAEDIPRRFLRWLILLRVFAVLLVMVFFLQPVVSCTRTEGEKRTVAVMVDSSRSMSVKDTPGLPGRLERVKQALSAGGVFKRLSEGFEPKLYFFSVDAEAVASPGDIALLGAEGSHTDLAGALKSVGRSSMIAAVVCISDGNHNAPGDPVAAAKEVAAPVFTVGVGLPECRAEMLKDIEVRDAVSSGRAVIGSRTSVGVRIEARGYDGLHSQILVRESGTGKVVGQVPFVLDDVVGEQEIQVEYTPFGEGLVGLVAEVPVEPGEAITENNSVRFVVDVAQSSVKILYMEGLIGPEGKFIRRLLFQDRDVQVVALIRVGQNAYISQGEVEGLTLKSLPDRKGVWERFDVFVFNNFPAQAAGEENLHLLRELISEGKGFLMMPGEFSFGPGGFAGSPLEEILPVTLSEDAPVTGEFPLSVPGRAVESPLVRMLREAVSAGNLKPLQMLHSGRVLPAAEPLLEVAESAQVNAENAVLVTGVWGKGRVVALLGGPTYHWRSAPSVYRGFWGSLVRYLAGKDAVEVERGTVVLSVEKPEFTLGETIVLLARFRDDEGGFSDAAEVSVVWSGPEGGGKALLASSGEGEYRGALTPEDLGAYTLQAVARLGGRSYNSEPFKIEVRRSEVEFQKIALNRDLLEAVSAASGGVFLTLDRVGEVPALLEHKLVVRKNTFIIDPADYGILYILLVCLISAEWYVRRRLELP